MTHFVYEDAKGTPVSDLITHFYSNTPIIACFVGGVAAVRDYVLSKSTKDTYVLFMDVVPDNKQTCVEFRGTRRALRHYPDVFCIPIVCMEEIILRTFVKHHVSDPYTVITTVDYKELNASVKSLEKYYKYLLDEERDCMTLGNYRRCTRRQLFYKQDCSCPDCVCRIPYEVKSRVLATSYPIYVEQDRDTYLRVQNERVSEFNELVRKLGETLGWSPAFIKERLL